MARMTLALCSWALFAIATVSVAAAGPCKVKPRPYVLDISTVKNASGPGPSHVAMLQVFTYDGADSMLSGYLSIDPMGVWPCHRHVAVDEHILVVKGSGEWHYWPLDAPAPVSAPIKHGSSVWMPRNVIHKIVNTSPDEPLELMITAAPGRMETEELYDDWPASPTDPGKELVMPWMVHCPPGQELEEPKDEL